MRMDGHNTRIEVKSKLLLCALLNYRLYKVGPADRERGGTWTDGRERVMGWWGQDGAADGYAYVRLRDVCVWVCADVVG